MRVAYTPHSDLSSSVESSNTPGWSRRGRTASGLNVQCSDFARQRGRRRTCAGRWARLARSPDARNRAAVPAGRAATGPHARLPRRPGAVPQTRSVVRVRFSIAWARDRPHVRFRARFATPQKNAAACSSAGRRVTRSVGATRLFHPAAPHRNPDCACTRSAAGLRRQTRRRNHPMRRREGLGAHPGDPAGSRGRAMRHRRSRSGSAESPGMSPLRRSAAHYEWRTHRQRAPFSG